MSALSKKKLSAALIGDVKKMVAKGELTSGQGLYRAIGVVEGIRTGNSSFGDWVGFTGDFEMINMLNGEIYRGSQFFPDNTTTETIKNKMVSIGAGETIEIALECAIDIDDKYPTGYAYVVRPIIENAANRLDGLRKRLEALPAPDAPEKKKGK